MKRAIDIHIFLGILFAMLLMSCEKRLSFQLTNQNPKVVMYAFPMPDSTLEIHASYTTNILSTNEYDGIENLHHSVKVNGEHKVNGSYPFEVNWLKIPSVIGQSNNSYTITYTHPDGTIISGQTSIPQITPIIQVDTIILAYPNEEGIKENMLRCTVRLKDQLTIKNYYQIKVDYVELNNESPSKTITENITFIKDDKVFLIRDDESVLLSGVDFQGTFTDHLFNGQTYDVKFLIPEEYLNKGSSDVDKKIKIQLFTLSPEYYSFIRSTIEEVAFRDYPIFDPINLYSNINNGIGVVAGLAVDEYAISLN